jgi:hypothetical protein
MSIAYKGTLPTIIHFSALQGSVYATENISLSKSSFSYENQGFFAEIPSNETYLIRYQDSISQLHYYVLPKELEWFERGEKTNFSSYRIVKEDQRIFKEYLEYILSQKLIPFE